MKIYLDFPPEPIIILMAFTLTIALFLFGIILSVLWMFREKSRGGGS